MVDRARPLMSSTLRIALRSAVVGLIGTAVGIGVLLAYAASEIAADPSLSLEDAYWIGRLPWTSIGVGLVVAGSTLAAVAGYLAVMTHGGIGRRVLGAVVAVPAAFWWTIELLQLQGVSGACATGSCVRPWIDPITNAYSQPEQTLLLLVLPALVLTALGTVPDASRRSA